MLSALLAAAITTSSIVLPGASVVAMDYLAFDAAHHRLWVPAGNTGRVDVIDTHSGKLTEIPGFPTRRPPSRGHPDMGPSSVAIGEGVVWIGNRGDNSVCAVSERTLKKTTCIPLPSQPDGLLWIPATHELWITTPRNHTLTIVNPSRKGADRVKTLPMKGEPEGFAVLGNTFFTNLEDMNKTIAIDVHSRKILGEEDTGCDAKGPRGLVAGSKEKLLLVACTDGVATLFVDRGAWGNPGLAGGKLTTGPGVDAIDYWPQQKLVYIPSGRTAELTIARVASDGTMTSVNTVPTAPGVRSVVIGEDGTAYAADSKEAKIIVIPPQ